MLFVTGLQEVPDDGGRAVFSGAFVVGFPLDRGEGAKHQAADVGKDSGAAGCDAIFGEECEEFGEGSMDSRRGREFLVGHGEEFGEVGGVLILQVMARAEIGRCAVMNGTALTACGVTILAAGPEIRG